MSASEIQCVGAVAGFPLDLVCTFPSVPGLPRGRPDLFNFANC